jgi:hypothetical protein
MVIRHEKSLLPARGMQIWDLRWKKTVSYLLVPRLCLNGVKLRSEDWEKQRFPENGTEGLQFTAENPPLPPFKKGG